MDRKYQAIAEKIKKLVMDSEYRLGGKIPSIRDLALTYGVSITTITAALRLLESQGIIEAKDRVGYFASSRVLGDVGRSREREPVPKNLADNTFIRDLATLNQNHAVPLGSAIPADEYLPNRQIQKSLLRAARRTSETLSYWFPGTPAYLSAIARRMSNIGVNSTGSDIIATNGAQEAVMIALAALTNKGDTVAIASPSYPGILHALQMLELQVVEIPCFLHGPISLDTLEFATRNFEIKALCVSANCSNPTGYSLSDEDKQSLINICKKSDVAIIEDDVYGDLFHGKARPMPLKALDPDGNVIYCSSFSKTISPGLRAGWIHPGRYYQSIANQKYFFNLACPAITQIAVADFLDCGTYDLHLRKMRKVYQRNVNMLRNLVLRHFPEGTHCTVPDGGYVFWVTLPFAVDMEKIYEEALRHRIYFAPGSMFSVSKSAGRCLRVSGSNPVSTQVKDSIQYLADRIEESSHARSHDCQAH